MSDSITKNSNSYALLIGIDYYLPNRLPEGGFYPSLGGCVRDINNVEDYIIQNFKVPKENILKLTSSKNVGSDKPSEPEVKWPTYDNMVNAFIKVTDIAQAGDQLYIHYSGHGGRATTAYPQIKGDDGLDETLVPLDIGNPKVRYLRDLELADILKKMVDKGLVVTIVLDSCHSGGATRKALDERGSDIINDVYVRGISNVDTTLRPTNSLVANNDELIKTWQDITSSASTIDKTRGFESGSGWLPQTIGYTLIAACEPQESAHETVFEEGERNGALTYFLLKSFKKMAPGTTYKQIHNDIMTKIHTQFRFQTPMLEGEGNREVFGSNKVRLANTVNIKTVDNANKRVLLDAGNIHGVQKGAQFAVYPPGLKDISQIDKRIAIVEIDEASDTDSYAKIVHELQSDLKIEEGSQAVLIDSGTMNIKKKIRLVLQQNNKKISISDQKEALNKIRDVLPETGKGYLVLLEYDDNNKISNKDNQKPDYQVAINEKGEYEILDQSGLPIENLRPPIKKDEDGAADAVKRLVTRLVHLTNYNNIQQLDNPDSTSSLSNKLVIELYGLSEDYDDPRKRPRTDQLLPLETKGNVTIVKKGQKLALRIQNKLPKVPNRPEQNVIKITVLDLQPDWGIQQVYPNPDEANYRPLDPDSDDIIVFQGGLPPGYSEGKDVLKVFGAFEPTDFRWLELSPLDQPTTKGSSRLRSSARAPANQLEKLMSEITPDSVRDFNLVTPASYATKGWTISQLEVKIKEV